MTAKMQGRPLATLVLLAYNQEPFIRQAVAAALAQDYSPLEIILSDDCSTDRTPELLRAALAEYRGPHLVRLNRTSRNLGIADHLNTVMAIVTGDFVVVAAGDDVSAPNRTKELVAAWLGSHRQALSIHSSAIEIDEAGIGTGRLRKGCDDILLNDLDAHAALHLGVLGATQAWDMQVIRRFPPFFSFVINEDVVIPARAALLGRVLYLDRPLVQYRVGIGLSFEVERRRLSGQYDLSLSQLKRSYHLALQKHRDFRQVGALPGRTELFARARARALYPIWLRRGRRSRAGYVYFVRRCPLRHLLWEWIKYRWPRLVAGKQRIQFFISRNRGSWL